MKNTVNSTFHDIPGNNQNTKVVTTPGLNLVVTPLGVSNLTVVEL